MEVTAQRMHELLGGDVRDYINLESSAQKNVRNFFSELGKVAVIRFYVARGKQLIRP